MSDVLVANEPLFARLKIKDFLHTMQMLSRFASRETTVRVDEAFFRQLAAHVVGLSREPSDPDKLKELRFYGLLVMPTE